jgi:hypothetical protein
MQKLLREPLLHFLLIGAALFVVFGLVNDRISGDADNQFVVSAGRIEQLANIFTKTWQRPPTAEELKGLIDDFVLEEIYYRQADSNNNFTFPLANGVQKTSIIGGRPWKFGVQYWHYVESPDLFGPDWQIRLSVSPVVNLPW